MRCDVLVVGAGPAGSSLAMQLAQGGFHVLIADRRKFPRAKPCGEFLSPECVPYLEHLGLGNALADLGACQVAGMRLSGYGATARGTFRQLPDRPRHGRVGYGIQRERFDHYLLEAAIAAGAQFLPQHAFVALHRGLHDRVTGASLRTGEGLIDVQARWVVGADGVHSRVASELGVQRKIRWLDQFALVAHFSGVPAGAMADVQILPGGFLAATTVDSGLYAVNLVVPRQQLAARSERDWDSFLARHIANAPTFAERLTNARRTDPWIGIGPFGVRTTTPWAPGAALVGDAAGYIDPLTGEGIYFALFGARALGEALRSALSDARREADAMDRYREARRIELRPRMLASEALQRAIRHPWLVRSFLRALGRWPSLADLLVTLSGDTVNPRELCRPGFWRAWGASA